MQTFVNTADNDKLYANEDNQMNESTPREDLLSNLVPQAIFLGARKLYDLVLTLLFTVIAVVTLLVSAIVAIFN
ncbi:MAG: hypothetical protein F6K47_19530 [Symploca sp. SIO2E6]|nr:hypothetical protein [Symploca sp. SIO2E6]